MFALEYRYYNSNEWYAISKNDKEKFLKMCNGRDVGKKASKSVRYYNSGGCRNNGKRKSIIEKLEKKLNNQKRQLSAFNTVDKSGSDNEDSDESDKEDRILNHYVLTHQGRSKISKKRVTWYASIY